MFVLAMWSADESEWKFRSCCRERSALLQVWWLAPGSIVRGGAWSRDQEFETLTCCSHQNFSSCYLLCCLKRSCPKWTRSLALLDKEILDIVLTCPNRNQQRHSSCTHCWASHPHQTPSCSKIYPFSSDFSSLIASPLRLVAQKLASIHSDSFPYRANPGTKWGKYRR
jgi:hypothetical protein